MILKFFSIWDLRREYKTIIIDFWFKKDKNKYEIAIGSLKSSDELVEIYFDLIVKNERIKMLIDPFAPNVHLFYFIDIFIGI